MKSITFLLAIVLLVTVSCSTENDDSAEVSIDASGLSDNKLAINATATFAAELLNYEGDTANLTYLWTLSTEHGELSDGSSTLSNPAFGNSTIFCIGRIVGEEQIRVEVLDADGNIIATQTHDFEIVPSVIDLEFPRGCYDQPKMVYSRGFTGHVCNYDGTGQESVAFSGGLSVAISSDGEWLASNPYVSAMGRYSMHVARCDGSEQIEIPYQPTEGSDYIPQFSRDSKTLYFLRPNPTQDFPVNSNGLSDIYAYNVETGEGSFLTSQYQLGKNINYFTVSPVTGDIAFLCQSYEYFPDGSYSVTTKLSFLQPESGLITDFITLPQGTYDYGMDWSPDGGDIIFCATTEIGRGIFRINTTDGSQPLLVLEDPDPNTTPYNYCYYYEGGSRIVFGDYGDNNNLNLYSVDANGNDKQLIADISGPTYLQGVLE